MHSYIKRTKYAADGLITLIVHENAELTILLEKRTALQPMLQAQHTNFVTMDLHEDFDDAHVIHAFDQWATSQRFNEALSSRIHELEELRKSIDNQSDSIAALCGALLQIAKQGISTIFGGLDGCPSSRHIGNEPLKNVIWQAQNQSIHFEEGRPCPAVIACFENLAQLDSALSVVPGSNRNPAGHVVRLLGWTTYEAYEADIASILVESSSSA